MAVPKKKKKNSNLYIKSNFFNKFNYTNFSDKKSNQIHNLYSKKINYSLLNYFTIVNYKK